MARKEKDENITMQPLAEDKVPSNAAEQVAVVADRPDADSKISKKRARDPEADIVQLYLHDIGMAALLTANEEIIYAKRAQAGDMAARERMINSNLRLVVKIARYYLNRGLSIGDVIEEGNIGLMKAITKFDTTKGYRFSTYATWWIRQAIEQAIMNQSRLIRLPVHILKKLSVCLKTVKQLAIKLQHTPTITEIAAVLEQPVAEVEELLTLIDTTISLDVPYGGEEIDHPLGDAIADLVSLNPEENLESYDTYHFLEQELAKLPKLHQDIVLHRFGLGEYETETLEELGARVHLTRERVRQIQVDALKQLKGSFLRAGMNDCTLFEE